jgi:hypothetical protein
MVIMVKSAMLDVCSPGLLRDVVAAANVVGDSSHEDAKRALDQLDNSDRCGANWRDAMDRDQLV